MLIPGSYTCQIEKNQLGHLHVFHLHWITFSSIPTVTCLFYLLLEICSVTCTLLSVCLYG